MGTAIRVGAEAVTPMTDDHLASARALRRLVEEEAEATEAGGTLSPRVVEAMREAGLFWMCVPTALGGGGAGVVESIRVVEEIAFADASAGWSLMANMGATTVASAYLGDDAIDAIFGGQRLPILAGMLGPAGQCVETPDGYLASGNFAFGSGSGHADWIGAGMLVMDDGRPRMLGAGPEVRVCFVPRDRIEFRGNWNVTGLVGTGSYDYGVPEQLVPRAFTFERTVCEPLRGGPLFSLGLAAIGAAGHSGVALGLMRRALAEIAEIASLKKRPGQKNVIAQGELFRRDFALNEAAYQGARDYTYRAYQEAEAQALSGQPLTAEHRHRLRQATTWVHQVADDVVHFCHLWAGSEAIRNGKVISRVSRDMAVASQHVFVDPVTLVDAAGPLIDHWRNVREGAL